MFNVKINLYIEDLSNGRGKWYSLPVSEEESEELWEMDSPAIADYETNLNILNICQDSIQDLDDMMYEVEELGEYEQK